MIEPNKDRLRLWTAALRSGDYAQATNQLRRTMNAIEVGYRGAEPEYGYCCLGVAQRVCMDNGGPGTETDLGDRGYPALEIAEWFGLPHRNPNLNFGDDWHTASFANDDRGKTFLEIADAIDRTFGLVEVAA